MQTVNIQKVPNQSFSITIESVSYDFEIATFKDITYVSVTIDGENVVNSYRCVNNGLVIPFPFMQKKGKGNFIFFDTNGDYPNYKNFGDSCNLYYFSLNEMIELYLSKKNRENAQHQGA